MSSNPDSVAHPRAAVKGELLPTERAIVTVDAIERLRNAVLHQYDRKRKDRASASDYHYVPPLWLRPFQHERVSQRRERRKEQHEVNHVERRAKNLARPNRPHAREQDDLGQDQA